MPNRLGLRRRPSGRPRLADCWHTLIGYFDSAGFAMIDRLLDEIKVVVVISPESVMRPAAELVNLPIYDSVTDARKPMEPA